MTHGSLVGHTYSLRDEIRGIKFVDSRVCLCVYITFRQKADGNHALKDVTNFGLESPHNRFPRQGLSRQVGLHEHSYTEYQTHQTLPDVEAMVQILMQMPLVDVHCSVSTRTVRQQL